MRRRLLQFWPDASAWPMLLASLAVVPMPVRLWVLRRRGNRIAPDVRIHSGTMVFGSQVTVGRRAYINRGCSIQAAVAVILGDDVHLGPGVRIITISHEIGPSGRRAGDRYSRPVTIGAGAWVGAGSQILPGVTVGPGAIVAAGSVVTDDVAADTIVGGVPARMIRSLAG
jgi:acetyltransferase-like isoleucine patch superfamily enzyme